MLPTNDASTQSRSPNAKSLTSNVRGGLCLAVSSRPAPFRIRPAPSALECGDNHAAGIARRIGVSRQFVTHQVKHFCALGYLQQRPGHGKQIIISFTDRGEQLMADARLVLAEIDAQIATGSGDQYLEKCLQLLQKMNAALTT